MPSKPTGKSDKPRGLTRKQTLFVAEYLVDSNGTRSATAAGYSAKTAGVLANQLLNKPLIRAEIDAATKGQLDRLEITADRVLRELARIGFLDLRKLYREDGSLGPPHEWDDDTAAAVSGVDVLEEFSGKGDDRALTGYTRKVRTVDKKGALELLGKHLKIFNDPGSKDNPINVIHQVTRVVVDPVKDADPGKDAHVFTDNQKITD